MKKIINFKLIGGILIIVGNSIGGGMLALPVSNAAVGFVLGKNWLGGAKPILIFENSTCKVTSGLPLAYV